MEKLILRDRKMCEKLGVKNIVKLLLDKTLRLLKTVDGAIKTQYDKLGQYLIGKIFLKLLSEIPLAVLIAGATYLGSYWYDGMILESQVNEKIDRIYISISNEYIKELFGVPYVSLYEKNGLLNNFYVNDEVVLRTVSEQEKIVAFFVTSTDEERLIPIDSYETMEQIIGETVFAEVEFANPTCNGYYDGLGRRNYYSEVQGTGRYGMYNTYVYALMPYGFKNEYNAELVLSANLPDSEKWRSVEEIRKYAKPNTYGVIADGYENMISMIPDSEEWLNVYHLLDINE